LINEINQFCLFLYFYYYIRNQTIGKEINQENMAKRIKTSCGALGCNASDNLKFCSKCRIQQYCCVDHQKSDWKLHKRFCKESCVHQEVKFIELIRSSNKKIRHPSDFNLVSNEEREKHSTVYANALVDSLKNDVYPPECIETIYGITMRVTPSNNTTYIGMDFPIGQLVYNCWAFLFKSYHRNTIKNEDCDILDGFVDIDDYYALRDTAAKILKKEIAVAISAGKLPQYFNETVTLQNQILRETLGYQDSYAEEIMRRQFKGIPWDFIALAAVQNM
jgi:hypothetical protein